MDIRALGPGDADAVLAAGALFDSAPRLDWTETFLTAPGHHLLVAYVERAAAGFVTGVEMTHPDKGTEMFLYELGVSEMFRGRGVGRQLVAALAAVARRRGCYGMWVLTEPDNDAATRTYLAAGGRSHGSPRMLVWDFATAADR